MPSAKQPNEMGGFTPLPYGGMSMVLPSGPAGRPVIRTRVYDPALTAEQRAAADTYFRWTDSVIARIMLVSAPLLVIWIYGRTLPGPWWAWLAGGAAAGYGIWLAVQRRRAARARDVLPHVRTQPLQVFPGRRHWFKPDLPATLSDPGAAAALDALGRVAVLVEQELVAERDWRDLWQQTFDFLGQSPDVRSVLGWQGLEARAHALIDRARSTQISGAASTAPESPASAPATPPSTSTTN